MACDVATPVKWARLVAADENTHMCTFQKPSRVLRWMIVLPKAQWGMPSGDGRASILLEQGFLRGRGFCTEGVRRSLKGGNSQSSISLHIVILFVSARALSCELTQCRKELNVHRLIPCCMTDHPLTRCAREHTRQNVPRWRVPTNTQRKYNMTHTRQLLHYLRQDFWFAKCPVGFFLRNSPKKLPASGTREQ